MKGKDSGETTSMPPHFAIPDPPARRQIHLGTAMRGIALAAAMCWALRALGPGECVAMAAFLVTFVAAVVVLILAVLAFFGVFMALGWLGFVAVAIFDRARIRARREAPWSD
jgi:hypothetical protein